MKIFANRMVNVRSADDRVRGRTGCITLLMEFDADADARGKLEITNLSAHPIAGGADSVTPQGVSELRSERDPQVGLARSKPWPADYPANFDCLLSQIRDYSAAGNGAKLHTAWFARCCTGKGVRVFLFAAGANDVNRRTICKVAADVFLSLQSEGPPDIISSQKIERVQVAGKSLKSVLPAPQHLPPEVNESGFLSVLDILCNWQGEATAVRSSKGNPVRQAIISQLALEFETVFQKQHVGCIHDLVMLGWPDASVSSTQRRIDEAREAIETQAVQNRASRKKADIDSIRAGEVAMAAASRSSRIVSTKSQEMIDQLQRQIDRLRSGRTRFCSDADLARSLISDACEFQELGLGAEVSSNLKATASERGLIDQND